MDLPAFVAMISQGSGNPNDQPLYDRLWGAGFLPSQYQGVKFRSSGDPVLYLSNPAGIDASFRRGLLDDIAELNGQKLEQVSDPEIATRTAQYELAFRMQTSVPELTDLTEEPDHIFELYGPDSRKPGTFAANCLLARRLAERGVRFIQLFHRGWDQHLNLPRQIEGQCRDTDQPAAALVKDLRQRGLLDETLVIWGGEFGRTVYCQGQLTADNYGAIIIRDVSRSGWPAAAYAPASPGARPTTSLIISCKTRCTCTTCTQPFCTHWDWTTLGWSIGFRAVTFDSRMCMAKSFRSCWVDLIVPSSGARRDRKVFGEAEWW
jgi:hypothetical protein